MYYDRINDTIYAISSNLRLLLSVSLTSTGKNGKTFKVHSECEYYRKGGTKARLINRRATGYLVFKLSSQPNSDVTISANQFDRFYHDLLKCKSWFDGSQAVFGQKDNRLFVLPAAKGKNNRIVIDNLVDNKTIVLEPIVLFDDVLGYGLGISMNLNNVAIENMSVDIYYGLVHVLTGFNMYMATSMLLTYVNTCTPEENPYIVNSQTVEEDYQQPDVDARVGRTFNSKKSFWDK